MDPTNNNGLGLNPSDTAGATAAGAAGGLPPNLPNGSVGGTGGATGTGTTGGTTTSSGIPDQQLMSSLMGQLSQHHPQMQALAGGGGGAAAASAPGQGAALTNQVPLLVGQTPLQQQLAALQGLAASGGAAGAAGGQLAGPGGAPSNNLSDAALLYSGAQGQQLPQANNTMQGFPQQLAAAQSLGQAQQQQQQQQQVNPMGMTGGLGMMGQNPLFGTASMGFNVQQLQQLQLAQQLMAAGLPVQLAFGMGGGAGGGLGGLGGQGPQSSLAALAASNPMAAALGGMTAPNATLGGGRMGTMGSGAAAGMSNPLAAASGMVRPGGGASAIDGQEWAEPFSGKGKKEPPFPLKLHQILSNPEFQECICWNSHGRSWRILKPPVFEQLVIPLYFRHAKYASFMRQVNGWGFKRIVSGNDHNSYYHEMFLRDYPQLCLKMKRIRKDKVSEAVEEQEAKAAEAANAGGNQTSGGGDAPDSSEGGHKDTNEEAEEDGNEDQNPPSNAVKAMLNSSAPGSSVGLTSSMGQATSGTPSSGSQGGGRLDTAALLAGASAQLQSQQPPPTGQIASGGLDSNAIAKLQEALQGGAAGGAASLFGQQPQAQPSQAFSGLLGSSMGNLSGILGANALAAQLQAATQPPAPNAATGAASAQAIQEMVATLNQQRNNEPQGDSA